MVVTIRLFGEGSPPEGSASRAGADAAAFRDLNLAWIAHHFVVEAKDRAMLEDVERHIFAHDGRILMADLDAETVGTVALIPVSPARIELGKMAVAAGHRGAGIGRALMARAIAEARMMGASELWLESNTVLKPAIALYRSSGFVELPLDEGAPSPYARCNIRMLMRLD